MQKKKTNLIILILSALVIICCILIVNVVHLFSKPTETTIVKNGKLTKYEEVVGYIIRDEMVLDTKNYSGIMQTKVEDSMRVKNGGVIATYVSDSEEKYVKQMNELDRQIEEAMASQQTIYSTDAKALETNIQLLLYDVIKKNTDINSLHENKIKLNNHIKKKAQIVGELSPVGSKLKELITQRNEIEKQINNATQELKAPMAGLVSYRVDGYEDKLTPQKLSSLSQETLEKYDLNTNQVLVRNSNNVKIVNNFECYIAMWMDSPESQEASLNDKLYLKIENISDRLIPATIEYISEEDEGRLVIVKVQTEVEELAKYRKINMEVIWWTYEGLKLHKSLITKRTVQNESGEIVATLDSVTIKKAGFEEIAYVKVLKEFDDYVIVDNYTNQEYLAMGFSEQEIANFVTLKMYSEVIVNAQQN